MNNLYRKYQAETLALATTLVAVALALATGLKVPRHLTQYLVYFALFLYVIGSVITARYFRTQRDRVRSASLARLPPSENLGHRGILDQASSRYYLLGMSS